MKSLCRNIHLQVLVGLCFIAIVSSSEFTEDDAKEILRAHNYYRGLVDPIATNMQQMEWNVELAYMAQFWAGNCEYELNENRHTQSNTFSYVGQTLASTSSYTVNYTILIKNWFEMGKINYNYYSRYCTDEDGNEDEEGEACAPYTQLVWARTYAVGCGAIRCQELRGADDDAENVLFVVCNYGPGGNIYPGEPPYETGSETCSQCPSNKPFCVSNLCAESGAIHSVQISLSYLFLVVLVLLWQTVIH